MRRLKLKTEPEAFELGGVAFKCWPAGQYQRDLAKENAERAARKLAEASELSEAYGMPAGMVGKIVDRSLDLGEDLELEGVDTLGGFGTHLFAVELAVICIDSWEGVADEDGKEVKPSRQAISVLFLDTETPGKPRTMATAWLEKVLTLSALEAQEGNG